ncbi:hypothetical protein [Metabacillus rhizolycopersici]|uniref:Uncharacterized protein n=1 Tax=Metabacillus rhizolycopersici TaxID=2875709 RepID=A0ABS7UMT5_9BACI|nr:hypothetical protein [Metabacillus rhizolycopersici]MBZ5749616.1 hypothetical protein [Metabacillus rhizolycopersici]
MELESDIIDEVIPLLDIITILIVEDDPIIGIVLVALLKLVTEDKIAKVSLILLVIVLGTINFE